MTHRRAMRPLIFGEVLFDHFPDGSAVLGGAPFNVAWHLHAFGLEPLMISRIGNDELGRRILAAMQAWGMDCSGMQTDPLHSTGTVEVSFVDGEPAYDIVDRVAYDYIDSSQLPRLDETWLLYHGSLALRHATSAAALSELKRKYRGIRFVDINLRPPWWRRDAVLQLIDGAESIKLNEDELKQIYADIAEPSEQIRMLSGQVHEQIVLTRGERGATAVVIGEEETTSVVPEMAATVIDSVGAGDAFCSVLVAGELLGWSLSLTMQRAQAFASAIVGIRGATPQEKVFYHPFIDAWEIGE